MSEPIVVGLLAATVSTATPFLLAGLGELMVERSGVLNLSVEGLLLWGAFSAYVVALITGDPWLGVLVAAASALLFNLLFGILIITFHLDQIIIGISLNILILGTTSYLYRIIVGFRPAVPTIPNPLPTMHIPFLGYLPIVGKALFSHNIFTYISIFMLPILIYYFLTRTHVGLRIRAVGENPLYATFMGIDVNRYRYSLLALEGIMAGMAGSLYTLYINNLFLENMTGGKGFLIIALIIMGAWNPIFFLLTGLFFSFMSSFSYLLQVIGIDMPFQFTLLLPYLTAVILLTLAGRKVKPPFSLGKPFERVR